MNPPVGSVFNFLNLATSLLASWEDCLSLALDDAVSVRPRCPPHTAAAAEHTASGQKTRKTSTVIHNGICTRCVYWFYLRFHFLRSTKTLRAVCQLRACRDSAKDSRGVWWICALLWQCSLAWSYRSLIQNYSITHMHALVPANTGELHRPCQPCCDTEHDNVCNLPGVVCLPSALPFEVLPPVPL